MSDHILLLIGTHLYAVGAGIMGTINVYAVLRSRKNFPWFPWGPTGQAVISACLAGVFWPPFVVIFLVKWWQLYGRPPEA